MTLTKRQRNVRALVALLVLVTTLIGTWAAMLSSGRQAVDRFLRVLASADFLLVEGTFVDHTGERPRYARVDVPISDREDIDAIADVMRRGTPSTAIGDSILMRVFGARLATRVEGSFRIKAGGDDYSVDFRGSSLLRPNAWTLVELDGFSVQSVYKVLNERGLLHEGTREFIVRSESE